MSIKSKPKIDLGSNTRAKAAIIIHEVIVAKKSLTQSLEKHLKDLNDLDRALSSNIVHGVLREKNVLEQSIAQYLNKPLKGKNYIGYILILIGVYQLSYMHLAQHAIVSSCVGASALLKVEHLAKLINAILRHYIRDGLKICKSGNLQKDYSLDKWLFDKLNTYYKDQIEQLLFALNQKAPMYLRVNLKKITKEQYLKVLDEHNIEYLNEDNAYSIKLKEPCGVKNLPLYEQGYVSIQDKAAQMVVELLDLTDNLRVLDTCCAPGGKSAHILENNYKIDLLCLDQSQDRLDSAKANLKRLELNATFKQADAQNLDFLAKNSFDRILLDAPCSGTGVIRRHPDIKYLREQRDILALVKIQAKILDQAFDKLKKGGILVYTTCSLLKEENELQVQDFLTRHNNALLQKFIMDGQEVLTFQRLPSVDGPDGFFYAKIKKV